MNNQTLLFVKSDISQQHEVARVEMSQHTFACN